MTGNFEGGGEGVSEKLRDFEGTISVVSYR